MKPEMLNAMKEKLQQIPLPYKSMEVFGAINCNIHIETLGEKTAEQWRSILVQFCRKVKVVETFRHNKVNENTCLLPSRHKVFLIGAVV